MHAPTDTQLGATALAELKLHRPAERHAAQRLSSIRARKCDKEWTDDDGDMRPIPEQGRRQR